MKPIFGREAELSELLSRFGSLVFVEGHSGIGKTRLLEAACERARTQAVHVLWASGQELEKDFSFGVVRQLFEKLLRSGSEQDRKRLFDGPAVLAGPAIGVPTASDEQMPSPDSPFPLVHALYWLTANLAERQPLVLVVDDAHWADELSLRFLDYLAVRLEGLSVGLVVAARPAEPVHADQLWMLDQLRVRAGAGLLRLGPLGREAVAEMVCDQFSGAADQDLVTTCVEATGGNPFLLREVIEALIVDHVAPDEAAHLVGSLGPETVARSVMLRLARLPVAALPVANAVAVLDARAEIHYVAALCDLSTKEVDEAADALAAVGMLDDAHPRRFVHPIVRQAVYQQMTPASRSRLHAKAAFILMSEHEPPERVATHTFFSAPAGDQRVVQMLRDAAAVALSHGAGDQAQRFLERALAEPPSAESLVDVLAELGTAEAITGRDLMRANEHLEQAAAGTDDLGLRTERVRRAAHARLYMGDFAGAAELLGRERAVVADGERTTALRLLADEAGIGVLVPPIGAAAMAELEQYTNLAGECAAELTVLAELAGKRWLQGWINEAAEFALRAISGGTLMAAEGPGSVAVNHALAVLVDGDRFDEVEGPLGAAVALARDQGSLIALVSMTGLQAIVAWRRGMLAEVEALSRAVLDLSEASGTSLANPNYLAYLGAALVERGELTEAEEVISRTGVGPEMPNVTYGAMPFFARARLRLAQGRHAEALEDLLEVRSREHAMGVRHMRIPWRREAVEAALVLDDTGLAQDLATEQLELTERWDISSARGIALCTEGLARRGDRGIELLEEGSALLGASAARLDLARALLDLGVALRVEGRRAKARGPLRAAVDVARACGATALATRAHEELVTAGARPRRLQFSGLESLTASQRRVAALAARGESNRTIAAALFVTVRTVENHLAAVYLKLGISSRAELGQALGNDSG